MSKKILASILAVASVLSISATAFAGGGDTSEASSAPATTKAYDTTNGASYTISAPVSYGNVDATVPIDLNSIIINPYYAAVKTDDVKNKAFVASMVYEVKNNATDSSDGIKVMATTQVSKATGLVVVDADAEQPTGWADCVDAKDATKKVNEGETWNKLYTYDKITVKTDKTSGATTYTGGAYSAKQGNNVAINLVGNLDKDKAVDPTDTNSKLVAFKAKGANTDELGSTTTAKKSVFFTVVGEVSDKAPCMDKSYAWGKENLSLSIVLKVVPTDLA